MAADYHEDMSLLSEEDRNFVRALNSLREEIEAVDWYHQRVAATQDEALKEIMRHNAIEEMEHAAMTLEWLRRNMYGWNEQLKTYLFTEGNILEVEEGAESDEDDSVGSDDLGIGEL